jgi:16S rRNA (uracil1498-N3)-methyltransferase
MNIFLIKETNDSIAYLGEDESYHCIKVLRMRKGDEVELVDGSGGYYKGIIDEADAKLCAVRIRNKQTGRGKRDYKLHIAIAPTKNIDRFEWFLEKATEIGIDEITPLICQRSERREVKTERLNKVIVSAMKQSLKAYLPKLNNALLFSSFISGEASGDKFICTCEAPASAHLKNIYKAKASAFILIGPEGDFTAEEISDAGKNSFKEVSLGESRLRTETAGIVASHTVSLLNQI